VPALWEDAMEATIEIKESEYDDYYYESYRSFLYGENGA
jgi:hypothetical protein